MPKKYKLSWLDSYNAYNWGDDELKEYTETDFEVIVKNGIKNILKSVPHAEIENEDLDGWVDLFVWDFLEAEDLEDLKFQVENYDFGRNVDVFSVIDLETKEVVLTEEDV